MISVLNHVAFLVESIESVLEKNIFETSLLGKIEEFPSEGTRELYIGSTRQMGKLLLMQAHGPGPYQHALLKRGPGLHHLALDVLDVQEFVASLAGSGWLLHPKSLEFYKSMKQVWLSRPGVPVLIEVNESKKLVDGDYLIERVEFPFGEARLVESLGCDRLSLSSTARVVIKGAEFSLLKLK